MGDREMHKPYGPYEKYLKRPIDLLCGLAAVLVFCWLYILLIILGFIFMRENPFFIQERPGKNGKIFKLIKFRTVDNRRDKNGEYLPDEVRLNKYGRFLRKTSLDEYDIIGQIRKILENRGFREISPMNFLIIIPVSGGIPVI